MSASLIVLAVSLSLLSVCVYWSIRDAKLLGTFTRRHIWQATKDVSKGWGYYLGFVLVVGVVVFAPIFAAMVVLGEWAGLLWFPWLVVLGGIWSLWKRLRRRGALISAE